MATLNDDGSVAPPRPTAKAVLPFMAIGSIGVLSVFLPPYSDSGVEPVIMVSLFALTLCLFALSIRRDHRTWVDPAGPFLFFVVLALARDLSGGAASGLGPLVALPILWLAMIGSRRDLMASVFLTATMYSLPTLMIGAPEYPVMEWRRALLWSVFAAFIGPTIQGLVRRLAVESAKERTVRAELDGIMRSARLSSVITTDRDGLVTSFGVGSTKLLGHEAHDIVRIRSLEALHDPDEVDKVARELGVEPGFEVFRALARKAAPSRIWTYLRADGSRIYVRLAITELRDTEGELTGYLGVAIDTTAAVEAERALAASEARWRILSDHLPDTTLIVLDEELRVRVVSGAGEMRSSIEQGEGMLLANLVKPEDMDLWRPMIARAFDGKETTGELTAESGAEHEIVVTPLPQDADGGHRVLILARDVSTDRERARQVVRAKERAERLFADAPHGVAVLTTAGVVKQVNSAMAAIAGVLPAEIEGRPLGALSVTGDDRLDRHLAEVLVNRDQSAETDWTLRNGHGEDLHVTLSSRVLTESDTADDTLLVNVVDVSERHRYEQRLAHLADHDALTGLANRRKFDTDLTRHLEYGARYGMKGALLVLDLDHFKEVNDTLGHSAGDELIVSTAALLQRGARASDVVARLGGDEFAILLPDTDLAGAEVVARSIVDRIRDLTATLDGTRRRVTASVGVVEIGPESGSAGDLLALADMTMYDAKDAGRDQHVAFDESIHRQPRTGARLEWKARLESALENDAFVLHLQPILDLETGQISSAEALVRLNDRDELVQPGRFIYIAERSGLMPELDAWVIKHGIEVLSKLQAVDPDFSLEINLSGMSIGDPQIERVILDSLRIHDVDPSTLILEITETAAVADVEVARQFAERMTSAGCKFALDDFGAGFGSFYYLKHLLFDYVKIDGEFVANCHRSTVDRTILRSIVGIAHGLGKKTVAEYVEAVEILDVVREEGVDLAQGYLVGEPVPWEEFVMGPLASRKETER